MISKNALLCLLMSILAISFISCGGASKKPLSPEANLAQDAIELAEKIKKAYMNKDQSTLKDLSTSIGYLSLVGTTRSFDSAQLVFTPRWVDIINNMVSVEINWEGTWVSGEEKFQDRGLAVFVFSGSPLRLEDIQQSNPFKRPEL